MKLGVFLLLCFFWLPQPLAGQAVMSAPTPDTILAGPSVTFSWGTSTGATEYALWLGLSGPGSSSLFASGWMTTTSVQVTLPTKSSTVYARLYSLVNGKVLYNDYTYIEAPPLAGVPAVMVSPAPGSTLGTSNVGFTWTAGTAATQYILWLGLSGPGSSSLYASPWLTATSTTVPSLPERGATVYARLYSMVNGAIEYNDYTYLESTGTPATMVSPAPGGGLSTTNDNFTWTVGTDVTEYQLWLGIAGPGSSDWYVSGGLETTSVTVPKLPLIDAPVYARLYSLIGGVVQYNDYVYTETAASYVVDLSWDAPEDSPDPVAGYNIYRSPSGSTSYQILNVTVDKLATYEDETVQNGMSYDYIVESVDASGVTSVPTSPVQVTIP